MNNWFLYFLRKSIEQRKGRFLISLFAVLLTVSVASALATVSFGVREKIGAELRRYGANMIVTDQAGGAIAPGTADAVRGLREWVRDSSVQVYGSIELGDAAVEIAGLEPDKMTGFRITGTLPRGPGELMAGASLGDALRLREGAIIALGEGRVPFRVTAVFEKGPDEDSMLIMPLASAQRLLGIDGVNAILLSADTRRLHEVEEWVRKLHPSLSVRTLRQVAVAEERILARVQLLMLLVTAVVLFSSVIALASTMNANVIERREEIGLLKAMGARRSDIRNFFLAEAALSGLCGAVLGYLAGLLAAEAVSRAAFGSYVPVSVLLLPAALLTGMAIAVLSTTVPVTGAMKVSPAQILRGE